MSDSTKAIFSEGVAIEDRDDGSFTVTDIATGHPISGVIKYEVERDFDGDILDPKITYKVNLVMDTGKIKCVLTFRNMAI